MGITFAVRGNSLDARYSSAGKTPGNFNNEGVVVGSSAAFDASYINLAANNNNKGLYYPGRNNLPSGRACSVLIRCTIEDTSSFLGLWDFGGPHTTEYGRLSLVKANTTTLNTNMYSEAGTTIINNVTKSWTPTASVIYDLVFVTPGDTTSNGTILYADGSSLGTFTPTGSWPATRQQNLYSHICLGQTIGVSFTKIKVYEFVIWDSVINPTSVALTSGTGSLNGASRTAYVDVASFDGQSSTDPGIANVRTSTAYSIAGTSLTGTCAVPLAGQVETGVAVDATVGSLTPASALLDSDIETGFSVKESLRLILSSVAGKVSGTATTFVSRNVNDTKDRISATVDSSGNRTAITYDVSD